MQAIATMDSATALLNSFLAGIDATPKTKAGYAVGVKAFLQFLYRTGTTAPVEADVIAFKQSLAADGRQPTTVAMYISSVKALFRFLAKRGMYDDIAKDVKRARVSNTNKRDYLTGGQLNDVIETAGGNGETALRDRAIMLAMATSALRCIEVRRANIGDVRQMDGMTRLLVQGKGHAEKDDSVALAGPAERALRAYLKVRGEAKDGDPLFAGTGNRAHGERLTTQSISRIVKGHLRDAGFNSRRLTAHSLRHSAITITLQRNGGNIRAAQDFARHSNITTTTIYAHEIESASNRAQCASAVADAIGLDK